MPDFRSIQEEHPGDASAELLRRVLFGRMAGSPEANISGPEMGLLGLLPILAGLRGPSTSGARPVVRGFTPPAGLPSPSPTPSGSATSYNPLVETILARRLAGPPQGPMVPFQPAARATTTSDYTKLQPTSDLAARAAEVTPVTPLEPKVPKFTGQELVALVTRIKQGDESAKGELADMLNPLIGKMARGFASKLKSGSLGADDLTQEGHELAQRVATERAPAKFLPYLKRGLRTKFQELVDQSGNLNIPRDDARDLRKLDRANQLFYKLRGRTMSAEELQEATGIPAGRIREMYMGQEAEQSLAPSKFPKAGED